MPRVSVAHGIRAMLSPNDLNDRMAALTKPRPVRETLRVAIAAQNKLLK